MHKCPEMTKAKYCSLNIAVSCQALRAWMAEQSVILFAHPLAGRLNHSLTHWLTYCSSSVVYCRDTRVDWDLSCCCQIIQKHKHTSQCGHSKEHTIKPTQDFSQWWSDKTDHKILHTLYKNLKLNGFIVGTDSTLWGLCFMLQHLLPDGIRLY